MSQSSEQVTGQEKALPTRQFGWWDMFVDPDNDPRSDGGFTGERDTLLGFLRDQRLTLELKCSGLDAEQLARRSVEPSNMSLLGLVRHLADVERAWFRDHLAGQEAPRLYRTEEDRDADAEVAFGEQFVAATPDLAFAGHKGDVLREVLVHLIEEYARHNGHADFLRERIDGRVGQ